MDTFLAFRINGNDNQWSGKNSNHENRKDRRRQKLEFLFNSIKANDLESARQAYTSLLNFDQTLSDYPNFRKIGSALKDGNLYAAQYIIKEIDVHDVNFELTSTRLSDSKKILNSSFGSKNQLTSTKVDISA